MTLSPIINSAETINSDAAPSLNAAFTELHDLFGFWPVVLAPDGGARTKAQQAHLVAIGKSDTMNSDHREDFPARAAADIDNHQRFRNINEPLFESTLEKHGWFNMTNDGEPFPRERWHWAKHGITPAGGGGSSITNIEGEAMGILLIPNNDDGKWYAQSPDTGLSTVVADADTDIMLRYMQWVHGIADDKTNRWNAASFVTVQHYIRLVNPPTSGGGGTTPAGPSKEDIAAEVIRQLKLPGN